LKEVTVVIYTSANHVPQKRWWGRWVIGAGLALALLVAMPPVVQADTWNKQTVLTFSGPVQVPGQTLPAGSYVFRLMDSPSSRNIVQIYNQDQSRLYTTLLTVPEQRSQPAEETIVEMSEGRGGQPPALRSWTYPGDTTGQEFIYPSGTILMAKAEPASAPPTSVDTTGQEPPAPPLTAPPQTTPEAPRSRATQRDEQKPATKPEAEAQQPAPGSDQLPQTASSLPLVALTGLLLLAGAAVLRTARKSAR
jgi:LPXTG-motif cell wall-anchored protein